jgi:CRP/FNR family cyclic AMP-dependent transcriptional regulator
VFYLQKGRVRLTVVSKTGKEAILRVLSEGDFFNGESFLTGQTFAFAPQAH